MYKFENVERIDESVFNESILMETLANNPLLKQVDACFDRLLASIILYKSEIDGKTHIDETGFWENLDKEFYKIEDLIGKIFDIKFNFYVDTTNQTCWPSFIACTEITSRDMREISSKILEDGAGYHFYKLKKVKIWMEKSFFDLSKMTGFNGRHLTSILLHEIGHHVFLKVNVDIERKKSQQEVTVNELKLVSSIFMITLVLLPIGLAIYALAYQLAKYETLNSLKYVNTESNCDSVAVKYGYSKEIYEIFSYCAGPSNKEKEKFNWSLYRLERIYEMTEKEINDPTNSPKNIKVLKEMKKEMDKINKERENASLRYNGLDDLNKKKFLEKRTNEFKGTKLFNFFKNMASKIKL